ncbi:PD-(D/E)XK nuclease family protein [Cellulomonas humilata]|uniref:PD-(D/E)XK nuclease family protein n=1 Tax=Cellulomonas humilata TaxID=144055 RepID=A0A7Y6DYW1_9CELL|nr:PD-(D/E)XK nuclease family protein [Cellulomonas humilata]NUU18472.1 PD-(D/E)XK nuclease family protein [Cellulomonas humilata]
MFDVTTTAYGVPALTALRTIVSHLKRDDPMAPVVVVSPSQLAGTVARRHLAQHGSTATDVPGIAGIEVTTLDRLAERLVAQSLAPRRPATRPVVAAAWRRALRDDAGVFAEVADHPATVRALTRAHRELRDLSDDELEAAAAASSTARDTVRLHRVVTQTLARDWYDVRDLLDRATERVTQTASVVVYLPQDLSAAQRRFLEALAGVGDVHVLVGTTHTERADAGVRWLLNTHDTTGKVATATRVLNTSDSDDEVRAVVRDVVETLKTTPAERVAVLYASANPYGRLLHEQLQAAQIRVQGPGTRPVAERAIARAVLGILHLADGDVPRAELFRALADAPVRDYTGRRVPVSRWERTSREAGIVRGDDWDGRLAAYVAKQTAKANVAPDDADQRARRRAEAGAELRAFVGRLRDELAAADRTTSWAELSAWCLELVSDLIGVGDDLATLPPEERNALATITSVLRGLDVLDDIGDDASLTALRETLELELDDALPRVGRVGDGVLVAPLSEAIGLDLDVVHIVGLSEDLYPGRPRVDALLPDAVRTVAAGGLRTSRDAQNRAFRHLLAAFSSAPEVVASFPRGDLRSSSRRLPSRWLLGSLRELSGNKELAATEWQQAQYTEDSLATAGSFANALLTTPHVATDQEWRTRRAVEGGLEDGVVTAAGEMRRARGSEVFSRFDGNLGALAGLPDFADGSRSISPTALESYVSCPHSFFVQRLLGVSPIEAPEDLVTVSPADVGTLVHECLDRLVQDFADDLPGAGVPWSPDQRARLVTIAQELAAGVEAEGLSGHPRLWERERERIEADLQEMLDRDDEWRASVGARVVASEMPFGADDVPALGVAVTGGTVLLRGSADKVDIGSDGTIYVTDLKTGSRRSFKEITQDDPLAGATKFQLPVYALAAREQFGATTSAVKAGYWFVRKDPGRIDIDLTPEVEESLAHGVDVIVRSIAAGRFPLRAPDAPDFAWVQCPYCNPDGIGHGANRERWERKRHDVDLRELVELIEPEALS